MFCFSSTCEQTEAKREREGEKWRRVTKRFGCFFSLVCFSRADRWKVFQTFFSRAHALLKAFPGLLLRRRRSTRFSALLSGGACKSPSNRRRNKRREKKKRASKKRALSVEVEVGEKKIRFFFVRSFFSFRYPLSHSFPLLSKPINSFLPPPPVSPTRKQQNGCCPRHPVRDKLRSAPARKRERATARAARGEPKAWFAPIAFFSPGNRRPSRRELRSGRSCLLLDRKWTKRTKPNRIPRSLSIRALRSTPFPCSGDKPPVRRRRSENQSI